MEKLSSELFKKLKKDEIGKIRGGGGYQQEETGVNYDGTGVQFYVTNPGPNAKVDIDGEMAQS